jgi:hypothetical protein
MRVHGAAATRAVAADATDESSAIAVRSRFFFRDWNSHKLMAPLLLADDAARAWGPTGKVESG